MIEINVKEVRSNISSILDQVEQGEEVVITRRGKGRVLMTNFKQPPVPLQSLRTFREDLEIKGEPLSQTVIKQREEERY